MQSLICNNYVNHVNLCTSQTPVGSNGPFLTDNPWVELSSLTEPLDVHALFPHAERIALDLGAGDGTFAAAWAQKNPRTGVLAVERLLGRARKIARKAYYRNLRNLRVLRLESFYLVKYLLSEQSIDEIHIMHPDPWPKKRHRKHRLCSSVFFACAARVLKPSGRVYLTTDHTGYLSYALQAARSCPIFNHVPWVPQSDFPYSDFEKDFRAEGKLVFRQAWQIIKCPGY